MENKVWSEYTQEEKETLLHHWFSYHGSSVITTRDVIKFDIVTNQFTDQIYEVAINGYINKMNAKVLVMALRSNDVEKLFENTLKKDELSNEQKNIYTNYESEFLNMLVDSYNNPKAPVPLGEEELLEQIRPLELKRKYASR